MTNTFYHALASAGWILNIAGHLLVQYQNAYAFALQGFGIGLVIASYLTLFVKNREQKHEASSR